MWCKYASFEEGSYTILTSGTLPRGSYSASIRFKVPEATYGLYYVQFFQVSRSPITMQFMLRPNLWLTPSSATSGTEISVKGNGFPASDYGSLLIKNNILLAPIETSSSGTVSLHFEIPDIEIGSYTVTATTIKLGTEKAQTTLQVLSRSTEIIPFPPEDTTPPPEDNQENTDNTIVYPVTPPSTSYSLPPKPVIISPRNDSFGWFGEQTVTFNWGPVPEPEDATYTLEIGENFDFDPPLSNLLKTRLTSSTFSMVLPPGTYYWRVKAVDSQGNEGDWAYAPYAFKVGEFPMVLAITFAVVIVICILIAGILKAGRKKDNYYYY